MGDLETRARGIGRRDELRKTSDPLLCGTWCLSSEQFSQIRVACLGTTPGFLKGRVQTGGCICWCLPYLTREYTRALTETQVRNFHGRAQRGRRGSSTHSASTNLSIC